MNECEETEEGVHPSETPLCGQHDNQTKAQSPEKQQIPDSQVLSKPMVHIQALSRSASLSPRLDFSESLFSHPLKDVATADRYSVLSSDSWLDSLESLSSDLKKDSFWSSDSRISLGSRASSVSSCVSNQSKRSIDRDIDFKKNLLDFSYSLSSHPLKDVATADRYSVLSLDSGPDHKCALRTASAPVRLNFGKSPFSHPLKKVATADRYSVLSSYSGEKVKTAPPPPKSLLLEVVLR